MRILIVAILVMLPGFGWTEPQPWMKQDNPTELGLFYEVGDECPFTETELVTKIEGEYLRARLKPTRNTLFNLDVTVSCLPLETTGGRRTGYAVYASASWATRLEDFVYVRYMTDSAGTILAGGVDGKSYFLRTITDKVADALTDYLAANFGQ